MMENVYHPFILALKDDWGVCDEENKNEFLSNTEKFNNEVGEAIKLMNPN